MKRHLIALFLLCFLLTGPLLSATVAYADRIKDASLNLNLGYRVDQLDWNIANNTSGGSPNVLSELTWKDLKIFEMSLDGFLEVGNENFTHLSTVVKTHIGYGQSTSGNNRDSDYAGDNRTLEFSRSYADSEAQTLDLSVALGLKFPLGKSGFHLTPLFGYSYQRQDLRDTHGNQVISDQANLSVLYPSDVVPPLGPFPGLNSSYDAYWYGPWLGLDTDYVVNDRLKLTGGVEYHLANYSGKADWNLRGDFDHPLSFRQDATGSGILATLGVEYGFAAHWSLRLSGNYQVWNTGHGSHRAFLAAGGTESTRLNEVNWESYALQTGVSYRF